MPPGTNASSSPATSSRRNFLKTSLLGGTSAALTSISGCTGVIGGGDDIIKIGDLSPRTGPGAPYGIPKHAAAQLAVKEFNDNGGILGREVELLDPDPQSDPNRTSQLAKKFILEDEVDTIMGTVLGSSREAIRPLMAEHKMLLWLSATYSGGMCDQFVFNTGPDPTQQMSPMVPYMMDKFGSDVYTMAADYNFGRNSAARAKSIIEENGGTVVGEEFVPLSVSDFSSSINRITNEDPDWIMHLLVGGAHQSFFEQLESTGVHKPIGSTLAMGLTWDHITLEPPVMEDTHSCMVAFEELNTEKHKDFVSRIRDVNPDLPYVNQDAVNHYEAYQYWAKAVEQTGTTDRQEVAEALEAGDITLDYPENVRMTPVHSSTHDMHLARAEQDHTLNFLETFKNVEPSWLQERCELPDGSTWDDPITTWITASN